MDVTWEVVLIEWANCLKLSESINSLKDLQRSTFFENLLKLLLNSTEFSEGVDTTLFNLLRTKYPQVILKREPCLVQRPLNDLITVTSLLLHYCCIMDRRDDLTSPLCSRLSQKAQVTVKYFLEEMTSTVTNEQLSSIIADCMLKSHSCNLKDSCNWIASGDCPANSPLVELLQRTPILKKRLIDREVSKLMSVIEAERFEKADLQEELSAQIEKNTKLDKQLIQQTNEIKKLRSEIAVLENKTPPQNNSKNYLQTQRILQSEVDSLERYVAQLQKEIDQLKDDECKATERIKKLEAECHVWQDMALTTETNCDNLNDKLQKQDIEIGTLRVHCKELTDMLEDFRSSRVQNESSIMNDSIASNRKSFGHTFPMEDLGHSVIDVQLRDVQKENEDLKNTLKESVAKSEIVNTELMVTRKKYEDITEQFLNLQNNNKTLLEKVSSLMESENMLQATRLELIEALESIKVYRKKTEECCAEINSLQKELESTATALKISESTNVSLRNHINELAQENESFKTALEEEKKTYAELQRHADEIHEDFVILTENYNRTSFEIQSVKKVFEDYRSNIEANLRNLQNLIFGENAENVCDINDAFFNKMCECISSARSVELNDKKILSEKIESLVEIIRKLEENIENLSAKEEISSKELQILHKQLENAEKVNAELSNTCSRYSSEIERLNDVINNMTIVIEDLKRLKDVLQDKDQELVDLKKVRDNLSTDLEKAQNEIVILKEEKTDSKHRIVQLENNASELKENLADSESKRREMEKTEESLNRTVDELEKTNCAILIQLSEANKNISQKTMDIEDKEQIIRELDFLKKSLEAELESKHDIIEKSEIIEKDNLRVIKELNLQNESYCLKIEDLERNLQSTSLKHKETLCQLETITLEKEKAKEDAISQITYYGKNIEVLKITIERLENNLQLTNAELETNKKLQEEMEKERLAKDSQCNDLNKQIKEVTEKLSLKESECTDKDILAEKCSQELLMLKLELEEKKAGIRNLELNTEVVNAKMTTMDSMMAASNKRIQEQSAELNILRECKENLEAKCQEYEEHIKQVAGSLLKQYNESNKKKEELENSIKKLKNEKERMSTLLDENNEKMKKLVDHNNNTTKKYITQIDESVKAQKELQASIDKMNLKEIEYLEEIRCLKDELGLVSSKYTEALEAQQELKSEHDVQIRDLTENLHNMIEKYNTSVKLHTEGKELLEMTKKQIDVLEQDKAELSRQVTEQKKQFEQTEEDLKKEIHSKLESERLKSNESISNLNSEFEEYKTEQGRKIQELENSLEARQSEKIVLTDELKQVKEDYARLKTEYKISNESHLKHIEEMKEIFESQKEEFASQITILENDKKELTHDILALKAEKQQLLEEYENVLKVKDEELYRLKASLQDFKNKIENLVANQKLIEEQCELWEKRYEECATLNKTTVEEFESKIAKLKCASEIMETGKQVLQQECNQLTEELKTVKESTKLQISELTCTIACKDSVIASLESRLELLESSCKEKEIELLELELKFDIANKAIDVLKDEQAKSEMAWKNEREQCVEQNQLLEQQLSEEKSAHSSVLQNYNSVVEQLNNLKTEKQELEDQLCMFVRGEEIMKNAIKEYESALLEKTREIDSLKLIIQTNEAAVLGLNEMIQSNVQNISSLENEKQELRFKIKTIETDLNAAKKHRDDILDDQSKIIKEMENNLLRAHENAEAVRSELLERIEQLKSDKENQNSLIVNIETTLNEEIHSKELLEVRVLELENERSKFIQLFTIISGKINNLENLLAEKSIDSFCNEGEVFSVTSLENLTQKLNAIEDRALTALENKKVIETQASEFAVEIQRLSREKDELAQENIKLTKKCELTKERIKDSTAEIERLLKENGELLQEKDTLIEKCNILRKESVTNAEGKVNKENLVQSAKINMATDSKEDEWKRKYFTLKQKLTLSDHTKVNLEKKLQQVRDANKKLLENSNVITKEEHEKKLKDINAKYAELAQKYQESLSSNRNDSSCIQNGEEVEKLRAAYSDVISGKSKLEIEVLALQKELHDLALIREAYEKLVEENNKLITENDTITYKRSRDKEELIRVMKKEREQMEVKQNAKIQEIRSEYEGKLEKMKEKMIKLYKEEVDREMLKLSAEKNENLYLMRNLQQVKDNLKEAKLKIHETEFERDRALDALKLLQRQQQQRHDNDLFSSRESLQSVSSVDRNMYPRDSVSSRGFHLNLPTGVRNVNSRDILERQSYSRSASSNAITLPNDENLVMQHRNVDDRKLATLPRTSRMDIIEEVAVCRRRTSLTPVPSDIGKSLQMEDEEDDFNNKYLSDLKEGRCILPPGKESTANRVSELVYRNSLCPPHLKSSYPAETQFTSPGHFKDEDIKTGNIEFNDSMSTKLLPGEKPRTKKDVGTTSYKKPGPPTPSKNGGRLSLQGNEAFPREVLRDHNVEGKTPKRITPSRLKALFMGRNSSSVRDENQQPTTPKSKRLSIFRKPH